MISGEHTTRIYKLCAFLMFWLLNFIVWSHNTNSIWMYAWFLFFFFFWTLEKRWVNWRNWSSFKCIIKEGVEPPHIIFLVIHIPQEKKDQRALKLWFLIYKQCCVNQEIILENITKEHFSAKQKRCSDALIWVFILNIKCISFLRQKSKE